MNQIIKRVTKETLDNGNVITITDLNVNDSARHIKYQDISGKGTKYRNLICMHFETGIKIPERLSLGLIRMDIDGLLDTFKGYEHNGPNVMRDKDYAMRAAAGHDPLCQLVQAGLLDSRHMKTINDLFQKWCIEDGMPEWENKFYRRWLRRFWQGRFRPYK